MKGISFLMESLSRCFDLPSDNTSDGDLPLRAQPLGASNDETADNNNKTKKNTQKNSSRQNQSKKLTTKPLPELNIDHTNANNTDDEPSHWTDTFSIPQPKCCSPAGTQNPSSPVSKSRTKQHQQPQLSDSDEYSSAHVMASVKRQAYANSPRHRKPIKRLSQSNSSSSSEQDVFVLKEKSMARSQKRKADIFRKKVPSPHTSSSTLDSNHSIATSLASRFLAPLCFANPIIDEEDEDVHQWKIQRVQASMSGVDEETITSTQFFDAKYEHVVENHAPIPLYREFSVFNENSIGDEILKAFHSGSHNTIQSVYCRSMDGSGAKLAPHPRLNENVPQESAYFSSHDGSSDSESCSQKDNISRQDPLSNFRQMSLSATVIPPPPPRDTVSHPSNASVDVINQYDWTFRNPTIEESPSLKLISRSSLSTAALTPVCSSNTNCSNSPRENKSMKDSSNSSRMLTNQGVGHD